MSTEDEEDESKQVIEDLLVWTHKILHTVLLNVQSSQRDDVAVQVDSSENRSPTLWYVNYLTYSKFRI